MSLDLSYDHIFKSRSSLPWWPWVGNGFSSAAVKTMIVGESVYVWHLKEDAFHRRYANVDGLRITHENHALKFDKNSNYVRNIERAIFAARKPKSEQKLKLWSSVIYHNLVLEPLKTRSHRPNEGQYKDGWTEMLALAELLSIEQCLVYGLERKKLQALEDVLKDENLTYIKLPAGEKISKCKPRLIEVMVGGKPLRLLFVRHPSECFAWRKWGSVIRKYLHF